jgi:hypothetical protein
MIFAPDVPARDAGCALAWKSGARREEIGGTIGTRMDTARAAAADAWDGDSGNVAGGLQREWGV